MIGLALAGWVVASFSILTILHIIDARTSAKIEADLNARAASRKTQFNQGSTKP